jgi:hypothetical protein
LFEIVGGKHNNLSIFVNIKDGQGIPETLARKRPAEAGQLLEG